MTPRDQPTDEARASPRAFFDELSAAHARAQEAAGGSVDRTARIAERTFRLRFAGPALTDTLLRALAPRLTEHAERPDFTIGVWDGASTGTRPPRAPWTAEHLGARGEVAGFNADAIRTAFVPGTDAFCMFDERAGEGLFWLEDADRVKTWVATSPMRHLLGWALASDTSQMMHAAAVGNASGGVLITGASGSGKSTATLACLGSGLLLAGDDMVVVRSDPEPRVHAVYSTARLHVGHLERFPHLAPLAAAVGEDEKAMVHLAEHRPEELGSGFPLRAILLPRVVADGRTRLVPTPPARVLAALAPTTLFLLPGTAQRAFAVMARLARSLPAYSLELGADFQRTPELVQELLRR